MARYFLITPKESLDRFVLDSDREFLSKPVEVEPLYCDVVTRLVYVHCPSHVRGPCTFPVDRKNLKPEILLTRKQKEAVQWRESES